MTSAHRWHLRPWRQRYLAGELAGRLPCRLPQTAERRGALALLADIQDGTTEATMAAHGFTPKLITALVRAGLATMRVETIRAGGSPVDVTRIKIADAGRRALAEDR
jgi:hypothetical protein